MPPLPLPAVVADTMFDAVKAYAAPESRIAEIKVTAKRPAKPMGLRTAPDGARLRTLDLLDVDLALIATASLVSIVFT